MLHSKLLYKKGQDFLDIQNNSMEPLKMCKFCIRVLPFVPQFKLGVVDASSLAPSRLPPPPPRPTRGGGGVRVRVGVWCVVRVGVGVGGVGGVGGLGWGGGGVELCDERLQILSWRFQDLSDDKTHQLAVCYDLLA